MMSLIRLLTSRRNRKSRRRSTQSLRHNLRGRRLGAALETLEERVVLSAVVVTNATDDVDGDTSSIAALLNSPGNDGGISLREAIKAANQTGGADEITFDASLSGSTITLGGTQLELTDDVTVTGLGADQLTISGDNASRVFRVDDGVTAEISELTITKGNGSGFGSSGAGGGISNLGTLRVANSTIISNSATTAGGGIINQQTGTLEVINSTITNNSAGGNSAGAFGGGISNIGTVEVISGTITGNSAEDGGGGISSLSGTVEIVNSTISENSTEHGGGGIRNAGTVTVTNSTLSGNTANVSGGAITNLETLVVTNSTIVLNRADADGNGSGSGGAIARLPGASTTLHNSIVAGNVRGAEGSSDEVDDDLGLTQDFDSASAHNLIGHAGSSGGLSDGANGNIVGVDGSGTRPIGDVLDVVLTNNGGSTLTHALVPGSAAVDAGDPGFTPPPDFDQRGAPFDRIVNGTVDIGAFELSVQDPAPVGGLITVDEFADVVNPFDGLWSLREAVIHANSNPGDFEIQLADGTYWLTIAGPGEDFAATGDLDIHSNITIVGNGAGQTIIHAGGDGASIPELGDRVFHVVHGGASLTVEDVSVTGGTAVTISSADRGGGGFFIRDGALALTAVEVHENDGAFAGGGIFSQGTGSIVTLTDSTVSGNSANDGGGIRNLGGMLQVTASTIAGNSASIAGGIGTSGGTATIVNSTISGNSSSNTGGGIRNAGTLDVVNSTIVGNAAGTAGGGIADSSTSPTTTINNTIVAGNLLGTAANDIVETSNSISGSHNLIGDPDSAGPFTNGVDGNVVGQDDTSGGRELLELATVFFDTNTDGQIDADDLADNGGLTETLALLAGSPAIDAGNNSLAVDADGDPLTTDQRGAGFDRIVNGAVDIGAFEVQNSAPTANAGGPYTVAEGSNLVLDASSTFDGEHPNTTLIYEWDLDYNGVTFDVDTIGMQPTVNFSDNFDPRDIAVRVTDDGGLTDIAITTLEVTNVDPVAMFTAPASVTYGTAVTVEFTAPFDPSSVDTAAGFHYAFDLDPVALDNTTYTTADPAATESFLLDAGAYTIYARIIDKDDGFTQYQASVTVDPATLTVDADHQTKVYGDADAALTFDASGFQFNDDESILTGGLARAAGENVGSYAIGQGTLAANSNYTIDFTDHDLEITPATLTVTADDQTKTYDGQTFDDFTVSYSGFVAGEDQNVLGGTLDFGGSAVAAVDAGSYQITASGLTSDNYDITFEDGTLTIEQADAVIVVNGTTVTYDGNPHGATGTATGAAGEDLTGLLDLGDTFTDVPGGTAEWTFAGDNNHHAASGSVEIVIIGGVSLADDGTLWIVGTNDNDRVHLNGHGGRGGGQIKVHTDFYLTGKHRSFSTDNIDRIIVNLLGGDDHLTIAGNVNIPALIRAGGGDDHIHTAGGPAVVVGGSGDDYIKGGAGRNILIGGRGANELHAGRGGDVLIAGTTDLDDDDEALLDLLEEWNSPNPFNDLLDAIAVEHHGASNKLVGGAGMDLFFASLDDELRGNKRRYTVA